MEPDHDEHDPDTDQAAMARFLGFSSFGSQNPPKKRKFNARTDAFIAGASPLRPGNGSDASHGSGGNSVALGKTRELGKGTDQAVRNSDEIDIDDNTIGTRDETRAPVEATTETIVVDLEDPEPAYIDTSKPPPAPDAASALTAQGAIYCLPISLRDSLPGEARTGASTATEDQSIAQSLTIQPGQSSSDTGPRSARSHTQQPYQKSSRPDNRGRRNELWYVDYYDPGFNENPWTKCEREKNLSPRGSWVQRPTRT